MTNSAIASIPMKVIGPIKIIGAEVNGDISVPLATFETPLWPSTNRGAKVSTLTSGIAATIIKDCMTRSVLAEAPDAAYANQVLENLQQQQSQLQEIVRTTSRYATLLEWHGQVVGNLLFIRFSLQTGDASGHNMVTKAADALLTWLLSAYPQLQYISVTGNFCVDKKVSAINGILGRGKYVVAEIIIPKEICASRLKTTPEKIVNLNIKKTYWAPCWPAGSAPPMRILPICYWRFI